MNAKFRCECRASISSVIRIGHSYPYALESYLQMSVLSFNRSSQFSSTLTVQWHMKFFAFYCASCLPANEYWPTRKTTNCCGHGIMLILVSFSVCYLIASFCLRICIKVEMSAIFGWKSFEMNNNDREFVMKVRPERTHTRGKNSNDLRCCMASITSSRKHATSLMPKK